MKNNILLLYMPTAWQRMLPFPPLGIAVLGGHLKRQGIGVRVEDLEIRYWQRDVFERPPLKALARAMPLRFNNPKSIFNRRKHAAAYLERGLASREMKKVLEGFERCIPVDITAFTHVGFSVMSWDQLNVSLCFARYVKEKFNTRIVLGGSFMTGKMKELLRRFAFLDYLIIGEGEIPLARLLSGEEDGRIENMIYRRKGEVIANRSVSVYAENMEPDLSDLPLDLYRDQGPLLIPYEASKGCRNACRFCVTRRKKAYFKSPETVVRELKRIRDEQGVRSFLFFDNAINIDKRRSVELCERFISEKLAVAWSAYFIPEKEDRSYFKLLKDAGCIQLRWGIETFGNAALEEMNKRIDEKEISLSLRNAREAGIWNHLIFMVGHPGEKLRDVAAVARFMRGHKDCFRSAVLSPFVLERVSLLEEPDAYEELLSGNGGVRKTERFGIRFTTFKDRWIRQKLAFLDFVLRCNGIPFRGNFSRFKTHIEKRQFMYAAFAGRP